MKSKMLLTGIAAVLASAGANATEYRPFVGATMGMNGILYSGEYDDAAVANSMDLPNDFFGFGIEAGVRFGEHEQIYNGAVVLNVDATTDSQIDNKFTGATAADITMFNLSAMYDNYFRLSGDKAKRIDLVLGAGLGTMNYHIDAKDLSLYNSDTVYSPTVAFQVGLDFELNQHLTLSANTRMFVPTRSNYAADVTYIVGGAIKYMF